MENIGGISIKCLYKKFISFFLAFPVPTPVFNVSLLLRCCCCSVASSAPQFHHHLKTIDRNIKETSRTCSYLYFEYYIMKNSAACLYTFWIFLSKNMEKHIYLPKIFTDTIHYECIFLGKSTMKKFSRYVSTLLFLLVPLPVTCSKKTKRRNVGL